MISDKPIRILALAPGTQYLGYAVLDGVEILYHGVRALPGKQSPLATARQAHDIAGEIIRNLHPSVLVIVRHHRAGHSGTTPLAAVTLELEHVARRHGLLLLAFAPATIRKFVCGDSHASKRQFCRDLAHRYPELRVAYLRWRWWKEEFHAQQFAAVGAGLLARKQLSSLGDSQ